MQVRCTKYNEAQTTGENDGVFRLTVQSGLWNNDRAWAINFFLPMLRPVR